MVYVPIWFTVRRDVCLVTIGAKTVGTQVAIVSRSCREVVIALHTAVLRRAHDDELFV